jgi:hypothetical protein
MAQAIRQNAYRPRRVAIVNPHRRLTRAQKLAGFGGKRSQSAARSSHRRRAPRSNASIHRQKQPSFFRRTTCPQS